MPNFGLLWKLGIPWYTNIHRWLAWLIMAPRCLVNGLWHYCFHTSNYPSITQKKLHLQSDFAYNPPMVICFKPSFIIHSPLPTWPTPANSSLQVPAARSPGRSPEPVVHISLSGVSTYSYGTWPVYRFFAYQNLSNIVSLMVMFHSLPEKKKHCNFP